MKNKNIYIMTIVVLVAGGAIFAMPWSTQRKQLSPTAGKVELKYSIHI